MSRIDILLAALSGVKPSGAGRWMARCPAHADRTASLSVKELDDSRILMNCFGGCGTEDVLDAIGLRFSDLFPERLPGIGLPPVRGSLTPRELLEVLHHEVTVAALILSDVLKNRTVDEIDWSRLALAANRIASARNHVR